MPIHREERGRYLIEASAFPMPGGNKWQPRLTMTRLCDPKELSKSQSFPGLTPLFETAKGGATRTRLETKKDGRARPSLHSLET